MFVKRVKKEERKRRWVKKISFILLGVIIVLFGLSGVVYYSMLNKHVYTYQNARGLAPYSAYEDLVREASCFTSDEGNQLQGYFYHMADCQTYKGVIIVNNGFGVGHEAMLSEIEALARQGYLIYGFDKTGYDESEGKGIGSVSQGVDDLLSAIEHVKTSEEAASLKIILYGKSWGAYCALSVLQETDDVAAVISLSAFNQPSDMIDSEVRRKLGRFGVIFEPFIYVYNRINEKQMTALSGLKHTQAKVLVMHSKDDETVPVEKSFYLFKEKCEMQDGIMYRLYEDKNHSIIGSESSLRYNQQMEEGLGQFMEAHHQSEMTEALWTEFLSQYDLKKCSEPDPEVIDEIVDFLDQI